MKNADNYARVFLPIGITVPGRRLMTLNVRLRPTAILIKVGWTRPRPCIIPMLMPYGIIKHGRA